MASIKDLPKIEDFLYKFFRLEHNAEDSKRMVEEWLEAH